MEDLKNKYGIEIIGKNVLLKGMTASGKTVGMLNLLRQYIHHTSYAIIVADPKEDWETSSDFRHKKLYSGLIHHPHSSDELMALLSLSEQSRFKVAVFIDEVDAISSNVMNKALQLGREKTNISLIVAGNLVSDMLKDFDWDIVFNFKDYNHLNLKTGEAYCETKNPFCQREIVKFRYIPYHLYFQDSGSDNSGNS